MDQSHDHYDPGQVQGQPAVLTLTVDGKRALTARDAESPYPAGAVGLVVESFDRGSVRVAFDDFVVRRVGS